MNEGHAYILKKNTRLDAWPAGTKCAIGKSEDNLKDAFDFALDAFEDMFGRIPKMEKVLFHGAFTKFYCIFEIAEMQD